MRDEWRSYSDGEKLALIVQAIIIVISIVFFGYKIACP